MAENIKQLSNAFSLGAGLNINSNQPIDSRFKVQTLVELTYDWKNKNNGGDILKHEGLLTYVESEGKTFRYRTGASYTSGETTIANWELVPVTADDINSLVEIPEVDIQSISVNGETVTPVDGNVNIIIPDVVHPEYTLEAGDANSVKLVKDGESAGEVSISLTADVVTTTEENTDKVTALSLATEQNIGKIILVKSEEGDYLAGTYIIDGVGSVKYLATTTGTKDEGDVDAKINSAIDSLDSSISAESGFLTGVTIENGKLVSYTSATVPEAPTYTAGDNISIEDNVISALGYKYDAEKNSFSVGSGNANATGQNSYAEGFYTSASGDNSHAEGKGVIAALTGYNWDLGSTSISFDSTQYTTITIGSVFKIENNGENLFVKVTAISDDKLTFTVDKSINLECDENSSLLFITGIALGENSHVEGYNTTASGNASHAEGTTTTASGPSAHAEGVGSTASGSTSHAEGQGTTASGLFSHAEGQVTIASGTASHAEGFKTKALGRRSHTEGYSTIANNTEEHAQGWFNVSNKKSDDFGDAGNTLHSIGIGTSEEARVNAQEVMQNGDFYVINVGGYDGTNINGEGVKTLQEVIEDVTTDLSSLGDYKVKDVIDTDKILAVDANGDLSSTISIAHVKSEDGTKNEIVLRGIDGVQIGEPIDASEFVVDGFLDSVSYDSTTHELVFVFNEYHEGVEGQKEVRVDLTTYIDNHTFNVVDGSWTSITITPTVSEDGTETVFNLTIDDSALTTKLESMEGEIADNSDQISDVLSMVEAIKQCTSGTISAAKSDAGEGEVSVVSNAQVDLSGDGSSLTGEFTAVNVVTKQYVTEVKTALDERITALENEVDDDTKCESATIKADTEVEVPTVDEVDVIKNEDIKLSGDGTSLTGDATAVKVVTKQYVTKVETALDERITALENEVDDDTKCTSATINADTEVEVPTEDEVDVFKNISINLSGDGTALTGDATAVKVVTKKYVDDKFESITDSDTKCTSATINADAEVEVPTVDEVDVLKNVAIDLSGDGTALTGTATAVKVVTKQYVDSKFAEVPTYTAITTDEINAIFEEKEG
jgi:hypothetical protein